MKTLIKNSEIQIFFEKTGTNLGITFEIVKDFHNCFFAITMGSKDSISNIRDEKLCNEKCFIIPHSTFKKIFSLIDDSNSVNLKQLHLLVEKKMLSFLRFAKNRAINGHLLAVLRKTAKFKVKFPNFLWFVVEKKTRKKQKDSSSSVKIVQEGGSGKLTQKTAGLDLEEFNNFLLQNKLIEDSNSDTEDNTIEPLQEVSVDMKITGDAVISNSNINFLKWATKKIKDQLHK